MASCKNRSNVYCTIATILSRFHVFVLGAALLSVVSVYLSMPSPVIARMSPPEIDNVCESVDEYDKGIAQMQKENYAEAIPHFSKAIELNPRGYTFYRRAFCYMHLKQYDKAADDFQLITQRFPRERGQAELGEALYHLQRYEEAIRCFSKHLKYYPCEYNRGVALIKLSNWNAAAADFSVLVKRYPECAECLVNRALCYENLGKKAQANSDRNRAYAIDPTLKGHTFSELKTAEREETDSVGIRFIDPP
jgi:tetratricopeptide (TPR) repeat protein